MSNVKVDNTSLNSNTWSCRECTYLNPRLAYPKCAVCHRTDRQLTESTVIYYYKKKNCHGFFFKNIVNTSASSTNTSISLTVRDRRTNDEANAERLFREIVSYCQKVILIFYSNLFNHFL
jgi:hypothetical protein